MILAAIVFSAASALVPPQPTSFETVNLRMTVDSCAFSAPTVRVAQSQNVIRVTQHLNNCFAAGTPLAVDVRLGALPAGDYRVEVFATDSASGTPTESLSFQVRDPAEIAIFPPAPRPLTDYSGIWFDPNESGWGLTLQQGATHTLFGLLFVYNPDGQPEWFSLQGGRWLGSTRWESMLFRTTGPYYLAMMFDPAQVRYSQVGIASLDFTDVPGQSGRALFSYTVNGSGTSKSIRRLPL
jgi:hypothetical protein